MSYTLGLDVGSTYTKGVVIDETKKILGTFMSRTGSQIEETANRVFDGVIAEAGIKKSNVEYITTTGFGRHQVSFRDLQVTDLTASARGAQFLFPKTRTVLDIGGQTMKASRIDNMCRVISFRLNDKCAAGTGAFLEKTVRYMGYTTTDIGKLLSVSKEKVSISGVCAVFAESEVISHLSDGVPPETIMHGAIFSLSNRSVQLMKRIKAEPEFTLIGGILRWEKMANIIRDHMKEEVNVPTGDLPQFVSALGCAILGQKMFMNKKQKAIVC